MMRLERNRWRFRGGSTALAVGVALAVSLGACGGDDGGTSPDDGPSGSITCSLDESLLFDGGVGRNGIPALTNPDFVPPDDPNADYLRPDDRVLGIELGGEHLAIPHNILWWHEIANLDRGSEQVAVTYCPLTGSTLTFDRSAVGGGEFGVSGLLFSNNLVMFDRTTKESLWPQMFREARCGPRDGTDLPMVQMVEIEWERWKELHPDTRVISSRTGFTRNYSLHPYGDYEQLNNERTLFPQPDLDTRRPPKERVLGVPDGTGGGVAFPFLSLEQLGPYGVVEDAVNGEAIVILWDGSGRAAAAFRPRAAGQTLTLEATGDGFVDAETGSSWTVDGRAVEGPMAGEELEAVERSYVAFWFAWAHFQPETRLWTAP